MADQNLIIKQLSLPDGSSYLFDATKLGGIEASGYIKRSEFDSLSGAVKGGIIFKGTDFATITVNEKTYTVTKQAIQGDAYVVPQSNTVINGVTCDSGDMWICINENGSVQPDDPATFEQFNVENWVIVQGNVDVAAIEESVLKHTHGLSGNTSSATDTITIDGSKFTFQGTQATHNHTLKVEAHSHTFSGSAATISANIDADEVEFRGSYTPEGSVSVTPSGSIVAGGVADKYTPEGTITGDGSHSHSVTIKVPVASSISIEESGDHEHDVSAKGNYTPAGNVNGGAHTVNTSTTEVLSEVSLTGSYEAATNTLTLSLTDSKETVVKSVEVPAHMLTFAGTAATISVTGTAATAGSHKHNGSVNTTEQNVSATTEGSTHSHAFKGKETTLGFSGNTVDGTFTGTPATITVKGTPTGSVTFSYKPDGAVNDGGAINATVSTATCAPEGTIKGTFTATTQGHAHSAGNLSMGNGTK